MASKDGSASSPDLARGGRLGRYIVLGTLGRGGMGVVLDAFDPELERAVAIKLLKPAASSTAEDEHDQSARFIREATLKPGHQHITLTMNNLAGALASQGKLAEAEQLHRRILLERRRTLAPDHPHIALTLNNLGDVLAYSGRWEEARASIAEALDIRERTLGTDHPAYALTLVSYA